MKAYFYSCRQPITEELLSLVDGKSYLLESVHTYALKVSLQLLRNCCLMSFVVRYLLETVQWGHSCIDYLLLMHILLHFNQYIEK